MCRYVTKLLTWLSWHFLACTVILDAFYQWYIFSVVKFENLFKLYIFVPITRWFSGNQMNQTAVKPVPNAAVRPSLFHRPQVWTWGKNEEQSELCADDLGVWEAQIMKKGDVGTSKWNKMASSNGSPDWETFVVHCSHESHPLEALTVYIIVLAEASNALDLTKLKIGLSDLIIKMGLGFEACLWLVTWRRCIFIHALKQILQMNDDHGSPIPWRCDWRRDVVSDVASWNIHSEISRIQIFKI